MSFYSEFRFIESLPDDSVSTEENDIYADSEWSKFLKVFSYIHNQASPVITNSYDQGYFYEVNNNKCIVPYVKCAETTGFPINNYLSNRVGNECVIPNANLYGDQLLTDNSHLRFNTLHNPGISANVNYFNSGTKAYSAGLSSYVSPIISRPYTGCLNSFDLEADNPKTAYGAYSFARPYEYVSGDNLVVKKSEWDLNIIRPIQSYGGINTEQSWLKYIGPSFDSYTKPIAVHLHNKPSSGLKVLDIPGFSTGDIWGYGENIGKKTKDLFALHDRLSLLTEQSNWLNSNATDEFYQSVHQSYGEAYLHYIKIWSEEVKLKIQQVKSKFDRLFKYIVKLKISIANIRRVNKKRVFRTKVNLVFKNLDDAHLPDLNYSYSVNAFYLTFKYSKSWNLTFSN
jgi:hypothetical protein